MQLPDIDLPEGIKLLQGDFRDRGKEIPDNSIDLNIDRSTIRCNFFTIIQGPGSVCTRVLKDGGSLATITGHKVLHKMCKLH